MPNPCNVLGAHSRHRLWVGPSANRRSPRFRGKTKPPFRHMDGPGPKGHGGPCPPPRCPLGPHKYQRLDHSECLRHPRRTLDHPNPTDNPKWNHDRFRGQCPNQTQTLALQPQFLAPECQKNQPHHQQVASPSNLWGGAGGFGCYFHPARAPRRAPTATHSGAQQHLRCNGPGHHAWPTRIPSLPLGVWDAASKSAVVRP